MESLSKREMKVKKEEKKKKKKKKKKEKKKKKKKKKKKVNYFLWQTVVKIDLNYLIKCSKQDPPLRHFLQPN